MPSLFYATMFTRYATYEAQLYVTVHFQQLCSRVQDMTPRYQSLILPCSYVHKIQSMKHTCIFCGDAPKCEDIFLCLQNKKHRCMEVLTILWLRSQKFKIRSVDAQFRIMSRNSKYETCMHITACPHSNFVVLIRSSYET